MGHQDQELSQPNVIIWSCTMRLLVLYHKNQALCKAMTVSLHIDAWTREVKALRAGLDAV